MKDYLPFDELTSPTKQMYFLLGLLLESEEPEDAQEFGISHWKDIVPPLQAAFSAYSWSLQTEEGGPTKQSRQEFKKHEITTFAHIDYFEKATLAFAEQTAERIRLYLAPFDNQLSKDLGLTATDALTIAEWIADSAQERLDRAFKEDCYDELDLLRWAGGGYHSQSSEFFRGKGVASRVTELLKETGKVRRSELIIQFGEKGKEFWKLFTIGRGEGKRLDFPTERSIVEKRAPNTFV